MKRIKERHDHEILNGDTNNEYKRILLKFINSFGRDKYSEITRDTSKQAGFDSFIGFPFTSFLEEERYLSHPNIKEINSILEAAIVKGDSCTSQEYLHLDNALQWITREEELWLFEHPDFKSKSIYEVSVIQSVLSLFNEIPTENNLNASHEEVTVKEEIKPHIEETVTPQVPVQQTPVPVPEVHPEVIFAETIKEKTPEKEKLHEDSPNFEGYLEVTAKDTAYNDRLLKKINGIQRKIVNPKGNQARKSPLYLGIFATKQYQELKSEINDYIKEAFDSLKKYNTSYNSDMLDAIKWDKGWSFVPSFHITTLFTGRKKISDSEQLENYNNFVAGVNFPFILHAVIYVPDVLVVGVTRVNRSLIAISNTFDHMSLMVKKPTLPKDSNTVLEEFFKNPINLKYLENNLQNLKEIIVEDITIHNSKKQAFFIPFSRKPDFDAVTDFFN